MQKPKLPACETERLQALLALNILDTKPEKTYDAITNLVKEFFEVPIVAISLVDSERQWFKSIQGLDVCETTREVSFCGHTILENEMLVVDNALEDERFFDNPLVTGPPNIRFYAGYPLRSSSGYRVGTLCIIDTKPRKFSKAKLKFLQMFASLIEKEFFEKRKSSGYLKEIAKIQEMYISNADHKELFEYILSFLLCHTASEYGFIGAVLIDKDTNKPYLKTYALTNIAWNDETQKFYHDNAPQGLEFKNLDTLFGYTLKTGKKIIANNAKNHPHAGGIPKGHPPLNSYLGMPIHSYDGLIAMYGLANRNGGYNEEIVNDLKAITQIMTSIIESARSIAIIDDMAKKDSLTNTYNRTFFKKHISDKINNASSNKIKHAVFMLDLDHFKNINDYHGHPIGDLILKAFVKRIMNSIKQDDILARIGGDEFMVYFDEIKSLKNAEKIAKRLIEVASEPYTVNKTKISSTVSIGIVCFPCDIKSYDELIKCADLALYKAKQSKSKYVFYAENIGADFKNKIELETRICKALMNDEFYCVYQPQFNMKNNELIGVEALLRWNNKNSTSKLIQVIESLDLGHDLNKYVLHKVIHDFNNISTKNKIKISVNISFREHDFQKHMLELAKIVQKAKLPANFTIEFEITENNLLSSNPIDSSIIKKLSKKLKEKNISLAIDDFGIKQSSINRLIECAFNTIKIDQCFVQRLDTEDSKEAVAIVKAVVSIAKDLKMQVIAEGAENTRQLKKLKELGVEIVQGYVFSKPIKISNLQKLLEK